MKVYRYIALLLTLTISANAQMLNIEASSLYASNNEEASQVFLIHDPVLEQSSKSILFKLYNFEFSDVQQEVKKLRAEFPDHPVSYFMQSLINWWLIISDPMDLKYDNDFIRDIDLTISIAERFYDVPESRAEASFFLSAAYGLKSQLMMMRKNWTKSATAGRSSLSYLNEVKDRNELSKELLFGQGLFNYYVEYIPDAYPLLKPLTIFLPSGDMELGKEQLLEVYEKACYTKIEAAVYLIEILQRSTPEDRAYANKMVRNLAKEYPNNPYFRKKLGGI